MIYLINKEINTYKVLNIFIIFLFLVCSLKNGKISQKLNTDKISGNCYLSPENSGVRIIHFVITRFLIEFYKAFGFPKKLKNEDYIPNGIRVMKKYLINSLENQYCKNFVWILMLGNKADITLVKSLLNFNNSFEKEVLYENDVKPYIRNRTKGYDVLITTRIDYDDEIYYDAVNDARKQININKPILLYGYNRGVSFYESNRKYYEFNYISKEGVWSVFISLITVLNKVNGTYIIYDLGDHSYLRREILKSYKSLGIKEINYEPTIFESGEPKFIYVRQKFSGSYDISIKKLKTQIVTDFDVNKFYGKFNK